MKQFLYLDIDIVNSIIAQSEQGLIESLSNEQVSSEMESEDSKASINVKSKLGGSLAKLVKAEAGLAGSLESMENGTSTLTMREIISKTMHDAAFDIAYSYISPIQADYGNCEIDDTGNYVEVKRVFDFIDFDYLEKLFEKEGIIEYIKKTTAKKIEDEAKKIKEGYNREQLRKAKINFNSAIKEAVNTSNDEFDEIAAIIKALRGLIPYNRMLVSNDGYLIPLNAKYFRIDSVDLGFKYGGEITCVGMVTNIIGKGTNPNDDKNIFATLQFTANEVLRSMLPTNRNSLCVIHPIAIYYGD